MTQTQLNQLINKIQKSLSKTNSGFLLSNPLDVFYLSSFQATFSKIFITPKNLFFITDDRYELEAEKKISSFFSLKIQKGSFTTLLEQIIKKEKISSLLIDSSYISVEQFQTYSKILSIDLIPANNPLAEYRIVKTKQEINLITHALRIAESSFLKILDIIKPGISEKDIKIELEYQFVKHGADTIGFDTIVASGPNSAVPHAHVSDRTIKHKDIVLIDFGAKYQGYISDTTRTLHVGNPTSVFKKRYQIIKETVERSEEKIHSSLFAADIDTNARTFLSKYNLDKYFTHSLGHGVGLEIHEKPFLNASSMEMLRPNMIATIEPGIYIKNWGGIRIEDMVIVKKTQSKVLTKLTKDLIIL